LVVLNGGGSRDEGEGRVQFRRPVDLLRDGNMMKRWSGMMIKKTGVCVLEDCQTNTGQVCMCV
jgi:hypothetical protein